MGNLAAVSKGARAAELQLLCECDPDFVGGIRRWSLAGGLLGGTQCHVVLGWLRNRRKFRIWLRGRLSVLEERA